MTAEGSPILPAAGVTLAVFSSRRGGPARNVPQAAHSLHNASYPTAANLLKFTNRMCRSGDSGGLAGNWHYVKSPAP
jgi:hypothetical protein